MFSRLFTVTALAALASSAVADLQILSPGGDNLWWITKSVNVISWTCTQNPTYSNFTILIANSNTNLLPQPMPIVAIEMNYDCSKQIDANQATQTPGTGYTLQFANPLNSTDVWVTSAPFEIKALGAAYPSTSATPSGATTGGAPTGASGAATGASGAGSGTASSPSPTESKKSGAARVGSSAFAAGVALAAAVAALA